MGHTCFCIEEEDDSEEEGEEEGFRDVDQHLPRRRCCIGTTRAPSVGHDLCINPRCCHTNRLGGGGGALQTGRSGNHGSPPTSQRQSRSCAKKKTISSVAGHHLHQVWSLYNYCGLFTCVAMEAIEASPTGVLIPLRMPVNIDLSFFTDLEE